VYLKWEFVGTFYRVVVGMGIIADMNILEMLTTVRVVIIHLPYNIAHHPVTIPSIGIVPNARYSKTDTHTSTVSSH